MNTMSRNALNSYSNVGVETNVGAASPHKLISLLFEGAIIAISIAKGHMIRKEVAAKGMAISRAIAIIDDGLKVSLDEKAGGELAQNLKALYEYMSNRLLMANLKNDVGGLDEVAKLLGDLKGAWDEIGKHAAGAAPQTVEEVPHRAASVSYGKA